jgi:hypothetical protein
VVLGIALLIVLLRKYKRDPESLRLWEMPLAATAPAADHDGGKRRKRRR